MSNMMNKFAEKLQGKDDSEQKEKNNARNMKTRSSNKGKDDMNMNMDMGHDQSEGKMKMDMGHDQSEGKMKMGQDQSEGKMNTGRGIANDWKTYENMKK
ncbi:hypothetical protein SUVZ_13G3070 [Saccharomyces uvarum]|uniref:Uncharacterized protein n=1 Tax=Saccharomyces uvarum TaxID=230603 RepID=A0ABN8WIJ3_SACUV|nr:hypothetical protein SUVZ_13G3070 [Saccharomyces uvarum]